jgi:hypothetical protein
LRTWVLVGGLALLGAAPAAADEFVSIPGGVADAAGKIGYVQAPKGGVDALDLATGKVLWSSAEVGRPLALTKQGLVVEVPEKGKANAVRLAVLDVNKQGARGRVTDVIQFPDWVSVSVTYGRAFASGATLDNQGRLLLQWHARAWYAGGARPTPQIEAAARKSADGVHRVDLDSGKVELLPGKSLPPKLPAPPKLGIKLEDGAQGAVALQGRVLYQLEGRGGKAFQTTRTLKAVDGASGQVLWQHAIWAPPYLPPLP